MTSKEKVIHNRTSTKKEDARVTRSKRDLALALQDLLRTKNFDDITIKEISQTAMVSKLTFYNNFLDKSDLLMFLFHKYSEEVYETLKKILESNYSLKEKYEKCVKAVIEYMHTIPFPINKVIKNDTSKVIYWNLTKFIEEAEKGYREIYNKGKERGYYQDVDFDTFEEIYTRTALSAIPKEDSQTREDHEEWSVERLVDAVAHDPETASRTSLEFEMPPMAYLHWSESKELEKAFGKNRFLPLSKANEVVQKLNNSYPPDSGYDKSLFSVLYFKRNASGVGFKDESFEHISYDIGSEPKNSDLSTHIRDYVDGVLKGDEDFLYTSEYSQQKELKERKARLADYKEQIVPVFEQYSKECSKAQNQIIEAVAEPVESKENPQSLTDLFANFDKAEQTQTPNNKINQPAADQAPVAPLLDDEVKVVGFNNDSDLTVLNSPTQSHKSPDIER